MSGWGGESDDHASVYHPGKSFLADVSVTFNRLTASTR